VNGIVAYGGYLPRHKLDRAAIGAVLGGARSRGSRRVAGYDEDATSMAVEAARLALAGVPRDRVRRLTLATSEPPYLDRTNAAAVHAALQLPPESLAVDMIGSTRSGAAALLAAADGPGTSLAVLSDLRSGLPGGSDERDGGDAAAAFLFGEGDDDLPVLADSIGAAVVTDELLDRWRIPGEPASRVWEERFAEEPYVAHGVDVLTRGLTAAGLDAAAVDHLVVAGLHQRAVRGVRSRSGVRREVVVADLADQAGNPGTAQAGLLLADVLDRAGADEVVAVVVLGDGAICQVFRTTAALPDHRAEQPVAHQLPAGRPVSYATFLTWRGQLHPEPPRRPDPQPPAAPPSYRSTAYKYGLVVGRCSACSTVNIPAERICIRCGAVDAQRPHALAEVPGRVVTMTVDHLAFSPSPPVVAVVVDFEGGGRLVCEMTDVAPDEVAVGMPVRMTFRRTVTTSGVHNYFWKAVPQDSGQEGVAIPVPVQAETTA